MCWATDGANFVQYWVTSNGESNVLCTMHPAEQIIAIEEQQRAFMWNIGSGVRIRVRPGSKRT